MHLQWCILQLDWRLESLTCVLFDADADDDQIGGGFDGVVRHIEWTAACSVANDFYCRLLARQALRYHLTCRQYIISTLHTHTRLMALFPGLPGWVGTRKVKSIWILLKQETVSGSSIKWAICKSASRSRQITTPAPHHSVFYRPDALPAAQPTASKHWRPQNFSRSQTCWLLKVNDNSCLTLRVTHTEKLQEIRIQRRADKSIVWKVTSGWYQHGI